MKRPIYTDLREISRAKVQGKKQANILNDFIREVEAELETSFTNKDKIKLKDEAPSFIINYLRPNFPFKKAEDDFNLQAMGINIDKLTSVFNKHNKNWKKYHYTIGKEGVFKLDIDKITEKKTYYAENEFQEQALTLAEDIIKLVERGIEQGIFYDGPHLTIKVAEAFEVLKLDGYSTTDNITNLIPSPRITSMGKHRNNIEGKKSYKK